MAAATFIDTFSVSESLLPYAFTKQILRASLNTSRGLSSHDQHVSELRNYDQTSIEMIHFSMPQIESMLLVFDGDTFKAFSLGGNKEKALSFRYVTAIPLMVHALKTTLPERFKPGQPHFQMVWAIDDLLYTTCVNVGVDCPYTKHFPPLISFSTMNRDETVLPTAKAFPNPHYITCMYRWKLLGENTCKWQEVDKSLEWEDLTPTIMWRGSDFPGFLPSYDAHKDFHWIRSPSLLNKMSRMTKMQVLDDVLEHWNEITPRWRAVALTLKAKEAKRATAPWIDAMFTGSVQKKVHDAFAAKGLNVADEKVMDGKTMSKARYQIDFGGGGGTTWEGTLTKLQMPGVLFHHETPTKDWFYDMMEPWKHYIPVSTGLEDLFKQYVWAQEHPEEAKAISDEASKLADTLLSAANMEKTYQDLFVTYLSEVVQAYQPTEHSWEECFARYKKNGIGVHEVAVCSGEKCHQEYAPNVYLDTY